MLFEKAEAVKLQKKLKLCDTTIERWGKKGAIPDRMYRKSTFMIDGLTLLEARKFLCMTRLSVVKDLKKRGILITTQSLVNWESGNFTPTQNIKPKIITYFRKKIKIVNDLAKWDE